MKRVLFAFCVVTLIAFGLKPAAATAATMRSSANFGMQFDAIAAGSAAMSSTSYAQPQTIIGQNVIWNQYTSASYDFQPTGVFLISNPESAVRTWQWY